MVDHAGKSSAFPGVQRHVDIFGHRHVTAYAVGRDAVADLFRHAAVLLLVALQASFGEQSGVPVLIAMRVVTRCARHLGLLKAGALFQSR